MCSPSRMFPLSNGATFTTQCVWRRDLSRGLFLRIVAPLHRRFKEGSEPLGPIFLLRSPVLRLLNSAPEGFSRLGILVKNADFHRDRTSDRRHLHVPPRILTPRLEPFQSPDLGDQLTALFEIRQLAQAD